MARIQPGDLLLLAEQIDTPTAESLAADDRCLTRVTCIAAAPYKVSDGVEIHPTLQEKVATLATRIVHDRPLVRRNLELAALAMPFLVLSNDREWREPPAGEPSTEEILATLEARRLDPGYLVRWIARRID